MKKLKPMQLAILAVILVALWQLLPIPDRLEESFYCPYCRAERHDTRYNWLWRTSTVSEDVLTAFWRTDIDPRHKHAWHRYSYTFQRGANRGVGCGYRDPRIMELPLQAEIAILKSFKTPAERRRFAEDHLVSGPQQKRGPMPTSVFGKIREAYLLNPNRKDWPRILKKLGVTK